MPGSHAHIPFGKQIDGDSEMTIGQIFIIIPEIILMVLGIMGIIFIIILILSRKDWILLIIVLCFLSILIGVLLEYAK